LRAHAKILILAILVAMFVLISSTVGEAADKIVVAYSGVSGFQGPLWAYKEMNLFQKYGLSPEIVLIGGGTQSMQTLLSGNVQFALGSATAPMSIKLQGGSVVIIAAALNKFPFSLVAQKEIRQPSQLVGKKIGIVNFGGSNDLAITLALKEWGIPRQEVTLVRSGDTTSRLVALSNRAIDATFLSPPSTTEAKKMGFTTLTHMGDMQAFFPMTVVAVTKDFLDKKRGMVKRFLKGYSEAIYRLMHSRNAMIGIYRKYLKQQDNKILAETYDDIAGKFSFPPRVNREGMRNTLQLINPMGGGKPSDPVDINQFIDESVLDELEKEGFFDAIGTK
jgi:ABC-type nitrate/sulfonate/bicarbonate transport system substrate-binding protein